MVVDDDEWVRRGRADALRQVGGFDVVKVVGPTEAIAYEAGWDTIDIVLVDAYDEREEFDHFSGVAVVEAVRRRRGPEDTLVIVISGHVLNDLLRLRMADAGADFFYGHAEVRDIAMLITVIRDPASARRLTRDPRAAQVGAALDLVRAAGLEDAFKPGTGQKALGVSRRSLINLRRRVAAVTGITPPRDHGGPASPRTLPEWKQVVRFINRARGEQSEQDK